MESFDLGGGEVDYEALEEIQMEMCDGEAFSASTLNKIGSLDTSTLRALFPIPENLILRNPDREAREVMNYDSGGPIGQIPASAFLGSISNAAGGEEVRLEDSKKEDEDGGQHPDALGGALEEEKKEALCTNGELQDEEGVDEKEKTIIQGLRGEEKKEDLKAEEALEASHDAIEEKSA